MNYLEISILFLFIGFLILFYFTNFIYNKCIYENKEGFEDDAQRKVREAAEAVARAEAEAKQAEENQRLALAQKEETERLSELRAQERASNKALQVKWDNTRNQQFGKFNSYLSSIDQNANSTLDSISQAQEIHVKNEATDGNFSDSTPVQLANLKGKLNQFYDFNKGRDASILDITNRMTKVNNILAQASAGQQIQG
jgi:F0F1-type ATP synthase membrane subunit b/b'